MNAQKTSILCLAIAVIMMLFVQGCGDSSSNAAYKVEYVPGTGMNAPKKGKTTFQLKISKTSDGSVATGLTPTLTFKMTMIDKMQHATPIDSVKESTTPGTYDCTVYYLMPSGPDMGTWEMAVNVNGEITTINPEVGMAMGTDSSLVKLYGQSDLISVSTGTENRTYYLFNDGVTAGMMGSGTLNIFVAAQDSMMSFPALASGGTTTLHDENGAAWTADPVTMDASMDLNTWVAGTNSAGGHWSFALSSGITSSVTTTIYVRLDVGRNGGTAERKTDSVVAAGSNGYQSIVATPKAGM